MAKNPKTRCGGKWTEARFRNFIISSMRVATLRWSPKHKCVDDVFTGMGINPKSGRRVKLFKCPECELNYQRKDMRADHVDPVVCPENGFTTWDEYIERMFVEADGFKAICVKCHKKKTAEERKRRKASK